MLTAVAKPILVGYDPTTRDLAPVRFAVAAAGLTGAQVVVAGVESGDPEDADAAGGTAATAPEAGEELVADCSEALAAVEDDLQTQGVGAECRRLRGPSAARALHEAAEATDAGLLVVGSTTRGAVGRLLPGSTAERLMQGAPCPVAVVPHGWEPRGGVTTIGVAYVNSEEGREALRSALALARRTGATLRLLSVVKAGMTMYAQTEAHTTERPSEPVRDVEAVEGEYRVRAEQALRETVAELDGDVPVEVDAFVGDPADVLIGVSENLDLLVCGSRGYGPLRAVLLGGVSRRVAAGASCPVVVLPRGVRAALEALVPDASGAAS
jgi:nucleotide-binding universal stress UspA family protein